MELKSVLNVVEKQKGSEQTLNDAFRCTRPEPKKLEQNPQNVKKEEFAGDVAS